MKRTLLIVSIVAGFFLFGAIWVYIHLLQDNSLEEVRSRGAIRVGYAIEAPYAFLLPGGEVTGESPEVAKYIIAALNIGQIEWRQLEFNALIPELVDGRIDVIAAGMYITPERARLVSFSEPTFHVQEGLLVAKGNPHSLHSFEDIAANRRIKIMVIPGTVEEQLLRRIGADHSQVVFAPDSLTAQIAIETGRADGLAFSSPSVRWIALSGKSGQVEEAQPFEQTYLPEFEHLGYGGFAFRQEDVQLREAWNNVIETFIGTPEHLNIITRFGFSPEELPGNITTQEILQSPGAMRP